MNNCSVGVEYNGGRPMVKCAVTDHVIMAQTAQSRTGLQFLSLMNRDTVCSSQIWDDILDVYGGTIRTDLILMDTIVPGSLMPT